MASLQQLPSLLTDATSYYRFESGALTTDWKSAYALTNNNTVGEGAGKFGGGADNGTSNNKYFSLADPWGYTNSSSFSISMWVKMNAEIGSGSQYLWTWHYGNSNDLVDYFVIYEYNGGTQRLVFQRNRNGVATDQFTHNVALGTSAFHQVVMTYDGSTVTGYLDGASVGSVASTGTGTNSGASSATIGGDGSTGSIQALYDDVVAFPRVLTAAEVRTIYQDAAGGYMI